MPTGHGTGFPHVFERAPASGTPTPSTRLEYPGQAAGIVERKDIRHAGMRLTRYTVYEM